MKMSHSTTYWVTPTEDMVDFPIIDDPENMTEEEMVRAAVSMWCQEHGYNPRKHNHGYTTIRAIIPHNGPETAKSITVSQFDADDRGGTGTTSRRTHLTEQDIIEEAKNRQDVGVVYVVTSQEGVFVKLTNSSKEAARIVAKAELSSGSKLMWQRQRLDEL